jgi:hypothetical protein
MIFTPIPDADAGLAAPSATHPAAGTSIEIGMAVFAFTDIGTRRASRRTADSSFVRAKIGPATFAGMRVLLTAPSKVAMRGLLLVDGGYP